MWSTGFLVGLCGRLQRTDSDREGLLGLLGAIDDSPSSREGWSWSSGNL